MKLIELKNVSKIYETGKNLSYTALSEINLTINSGEMVSILGKSGSGKSTLLNLIAGLDCSSDGEVLVANTSLNKMNETTLAKWRGNNIGIVFQFFQLLPALTIIENIMLAMDFTGLIPKKDRLTRAKFLLEQVDIIEQSNKLPSTLSGGQQQRAAIARSLANNPPVIVADEPTGNLDSKTAVYIHNLFIELVKQGKTVVIVTHDEELANKANRVIHLFDSKMIIKQDNKEIV